MLYFSIIYSLTISPVLVFNDIESDKALEICNCTSKNVAQGIQQSQNDYHCLQSSTWNMPDQTLVKQVHTTLLVSHSLALRCIEVAL